MTQAQLESLSEAVSIILRSGVCWDGENVIEISKRTATTALMFFERLPSPIVLPKLFPDGDGALVALWETSGKKTVVIFDEQFLHLTLNAATPDSEYFTDLEFPGEQIPSQILDALALVHNGQ
jgi:hypothetical protein